MSETWGARVEWVDAGHFVYFESAENFTSAVEDFLREAGIHE